MPTFTQADVDEYNARQAAASAVRKETASTACQKTCVPLESSAAFALAESTDEAHLNKTERSYLARLRANAEVQWVGIQNVTLKLGDDCRFTPDFCYIIGGRMTFVDTKGGFIREDSIIKIKTAARMFRWAKFVVAQLNKCQWTEKEIKP